MPMDNCNQTRTPYWEGRNARVMGRPINMVPNYLEDRAVNDFIMGWTDEEEEIIDLKWRMPKKTS
jgi:hypothetical protein